MNYLVDSHPVRYPVIEAILGVGGHVVYEDPQHGTSWGFVEETDAPSVVKEVIGVDMALPGSETTVVVPVKIVDGAPVLAGKPVVVPAPAAAPEAPAPVFSTMEATEDMAPVKVEALVVPVAKAPKKGAAL